jgi:hypothetical protein
VVHADITRTIGGTPLVELMRLTADQPGRLPWVSPNRGICTWLRDGTVRSDSIRLSLFSMVGVWNTDATKRARDT